jgi:hypothetical protein
MLNDGIHFLSRKHHGDIRPALGAHNIPDFAKVFLEDIPEKEQKRIECLVLR